MSKPNIATFHKAVAKSFAPLATNAKLAIEKLSEEIYEVLGKELTMRIRQGTGHRKDILVTLLPTAERPADNEDLSQEIGLGLVAEFSGETLAESTVDTEEEFMRYAGNLATAADKLLLPYLLGDRTDFVELKKFATARIENAVNGIPDYRFPKNVRKEWI